MRDLILSSRDRIFFVSTLWVALATALLCALLPVGLPLTSSVGSAFNPATTAVALKGKAEQMKVPEKRLLDDDSRSPADQLLHGAPGIPVPVQAMALRPAGHFDAIVLQRLDPLPLPSAAPMERAYPRGPPAA